VKHIAIQNEVFSIEGKPIKDRDEHTVDLKTMVRNFLYMLPVEKLLMKDSINAKKVVEAFDQGLDKISLEDEQYEWLHKMIEDYGPRVFGVNAIMIKEALEKRPEKVKGK